MRVTKYPQSCLLVEKDGQKIVIDPGNLVLRNFSFEQFKGVKAALITHQHADHLDEHFVDQLRDNGAVIYCNQDAAAKINGEKHIIKDGDTFTIGAFEIKVHDLPHCKMIDGSDGPPNSGYMIDGIFFHPGDGIDTSGLKAPKLALPIAGPSISFRESFKFALSLEAELVLPIHFDVFTADPHDFKKRAEQTKAQFAVIALDNGESAEI